MLLVVVVCDCSSSVGVCLLLSLFFCLLAFSSDVVRCCLLLFAVVCCCVLLFAVVRCCVLLFVVVCAVVAVCWLVFVFLFVV